MGYARQLAERKALQAEQWRWELRSGRGWEPRPVGHAVAELRLAEALRQEAFVAQRDAEGLRRGAVEEAQALLEARALLGGVDIEVTVATRPLRGALVFEERLALELRGELRSEESRAQVGSFETRFTPGPKDD